MRAWTIIISDREGGAMWMNTEEARTAREATVQGLATYIEEGHYDTDMIADVITVPGSHQDAAEWQINDRFAQDELLGAAASLLKEEAAR